MSKQKNGDEPEKVTDKELEAIIGNDRALVFKQLREQYEMSWEEQAKLIRSESPLMKTGVALALRVAKSFGLPLQGINVISSRAGQTVYVNSDGIRWRLHTDHRGFKRSTAEMMHVCTDAEPWVMAVATVEMGDGSTYTNIGVVGCSPGNGVEVSNAMMKAVTKAKRRAGVDAVGVALPIAEDYLEYIEEQRSSGKVVDGEYNIVPSGPMSEPKNLAEVLLWIQQTGHKIEDATQIVGDAQEMAKDISVTVEKLRKAWGL